MTSSSGNVSEVSNDAFQLRAVAEAHGLPAGSVRAGIVSSGRLSVSIQSVLEEVLRDTADLPPWRTRENPFLAEADLAHLDEDGMIRPGSLVRAEDTLVSIVAASGPAKNGRIPIEDGSWIVPANWDSSEVIDIQCESSTGRRREFPQGVLERYRVTLRRTIPFHIGDALAIAEVNFKTTGAVSDDLMPRDADGHPADIVVPTSVAERLGLAAKTVQACEVRRVGQPAVDVLKARAVGAYSLITMRPHCGKRVLRPGVRMTAEQLQWLQERSLFALLAEFTSLRSDDLQNRPLLAALADGELSNVESLVPAAPESLFEVQEYLWALGVGVALSPSEHCVQAVLWPAADAEIVERSHGAIRKPETLNYRTYLPEPGGLFCTTVFGPEDSLLRRRSAGHIELSEPVIPILWRLGPEPILGQILQLSEQDLEAIIFRQSTVFVRDGEVSLRPVDQLKKDSDNDGGMDLGTGCDAIAALLLRLPPASIPAAFGPAGERFFTRSIAMVPPDLRPLVRLANGNFATSDLNDMYRLLTNRNNRLRKLKDLNAPEVIIHNEIQQLQREVDRLHANSFLPASRQLMGSAHRPLVSLLDLLTHQIMTAAERVVEWCGQARGVACASVAPQTVHIPADIFDELQLTEAHPVLLTSACGSFLARRPHRIDGPVMLLTPEDAALLLEPESTVVVHRLITAAARAEAMQLLNDGSGHEARRIPGGDWCQSDDPQSISQQIILAASNRRKTQMKSLRGVALFGTGAVTSDPPDASIDRKDVEAHWIEKPAKKDPNLPSFEEMAEVIRGHARPGCIFHVERAAVEPDAGQGRIGGLPWMPPGSRWPRNLNGQPYDFVGQFPLDAARSSGCLPFDVPPGSILTVFAAEEWDHTASSRDGSLVVHGSHDLQRLQPPHDGYRPGKPCKVVPEIVSLYPSLDEALLIIDWELDSPSRKAVSQLKAKYEKEFFNPADKSRIGGYPHWIQSAVDIAFVAQISTDEVSDLNFGDSGAIYIHGSSPEDLEAFIQCY